MFVVAEFLLTSASRSPSAIAEPLVNFGLPGAIVNVITHSKCFVNQFRRFGVLTPENFAIIIKLAGLMVYLTTV